MLIEVLIALALFGLSAVYLVEGAFVASRTIRFMKDARELEQDLLWVRSQVFQQEDYEKLSEGGDIPTISMGDVQWETEVEMTTVTDLYKVSLTLVYDGNEELGVEAGKRIYHMLMLRPTWSRHSDFSSDRQRLWEERKELITELETERKKN